MISCVTVPDSPMSDAGARDVNMTSANGQKMSFVPIKDEHGGPSQPALAVLPPPGSHMDSSHVTSSGMMGISSSAVTPSRHNDNNNYHGISDRHAMVTSPPDLISDTLPKVTIEMPHDNDTVMVTSSIPKSEYSNPGGLSTSSSYHKRGSHQQHHHGHSGSSPARHDVKFQPLMVDTNTGHHHQHHQSAPVGHHHGVHQGKMAQLSPSAAGHPHGGCHPPPSSHKSSRPSTLNVNAGHPSHVSQHSSSASHGGHHHSGHGGHHTGNNNHHHGNNTGSHHGNNHGHHGNNNSSSSSHHHHHQHSNNNNHHHSNSNLAGNNMSSSSSSSHHKHRPPALNLGPGRPVAPAASSQHSPTVPLPVQPAQSAVFLNNNGPELHRFEHLLIDFDLMTF